MNFAGKAYLRNKERQPESKAPLPPSSFSDEEVKLAPIPSPAAKLTSAALNTIKEEAFEESHFNHKIKRQRSIECLSVSSLNHSLNSDSGSDCEDEELDSVPVPKPESKKFEMKVDTNVVSLDLSSLKEAGNIATGDPVFCSSCASAFNLYSRMSETSDSTQVWCCEFCGIENVVNIEVEEIPRGQMMDYVLMSSSQAFEESKEKAASEGITVIFCIDVSGSMCVTEPVAGKISIKNKKKFDLGGFADFDMAEQFLEGDTAVTYVSRLECVQAAIEAQLHSMSLTASTRKVGLVTFSSEVAIYGDGTSEPVVLAGNKLNVFETCLETGISLQHKLRNPIKDTEQNLIEKVLALSESGPTALGPALVAAIGLASEGVPGSRVIICTDGLANVGIGRLDDDPNVAEDFYTRAANIAKGKGIEVSVISIEGEECKLNKLSKVSEMTGGEVTRVNMNNIATEFANILETPVIATQVSAVIKIHKGLCFRYQDEYLLDMSTLKKDLGNVTDGNEFTFEYSVRNPEELLALNIDLDTIRQLPFQSQIHFTNKEGMRCMRVITALQDTTDNLDEAGDINLKVLGVNAAQRCAYLASKGEYRESQAVMRSWKRMMKRNAKNSEQLEAVDYYVSNLADFNRKVNGVAVDEALIGVDERVSNQKDGLSHMAFRAKKANKGAKKDCVVM